MPALTVLLAFIVSGAALAAAVYGTANLGKISYSGFLYHMIIASVMSFVYYNFPGGFENNFNRPSNEPVSLGECGYFSLVTHTTVGYGDIYPKTRMARLAVCLHVFLAFLGLSLIIPIEKTEFVQSRFVSGF